MSIDLGKIFFKSDTYDPSTKLPIYVLDTTALPNPNHCNFIGLIKLLISRIPNENYVLIFFTAGLSNDPSFSITNHGNSNNNYNHRLAFNNPEGDKENYNYTDDQKQQQNQQPQSGDSESFKFSWVWGVKTFSLIPSSKRKFLRKIYIVHESWWIRALIEVLKNLISSKFLNPSQEKVIHCSNLSELSRNLDITKINISLANYCYEFNKIYNNYSGSKDNDYKYQAPPKIIIPIHLPQVFGIPIAATAVSTNKNQLAHYYYNLIFIKIIQQYYQPKNNNGKYNLLLFHNNSPSLIFKSNILQDSISRNQIVTLDQYDIFTLVNLWKYFLKNLRSDYALIPLNILVKQHQNFDENNKNHDIPLTNHVLNEILKVNKSKIILNDIMNFLLIPMIINDVNHISLNNNTSNANDLCSNYLNRLCKFLTKFFCGIISDSPEKDRALGARFIKSLITNWPYLDANKYKIAYKKVAPPVPTSRKSSNEKLSSSVGSSSPPSTPHAIMQVPLPPLSKVPVALSLVPTTVTAGSSLIQSFVAYLNQTDAMSINLRFINSKQAIFERLGDSNGLNNFNIIPDSDIEAQQYKHLHYVRNEDLDAFHDEKETQPNLKSLNNKIKTNIKSYFKPLTESSNSALSSSSSSHFDNNANSGSGSSSGSTGVDLINKSLGTLNFNTKSKGQPSIPPRLPPRSNHNASINNHRNSIATDENNNFKKPPIPPPSRTSGFDLNNNLARKQSNSYLFDSSGSGDVSADNTMVSSNTVGGDVGGNLIVGKKASSASITSSSSNSSDGYNNSCSSMGDRPPVPQKKTCGYYGHYKSSSGSCNNILIASNNSNIAANSVANGATSKKPAPRVIRKIPSQSEFIYADKKKYAGIQNGKVVKLAQLFEERLEGLEILSTMEASH